MDFNRLSDGTVVPFSLDTQAIADVLAKSATSQALLQLLFTRYS